MFTRRVQVGESWKEAVNKRIEHEQKLKRLQELKEQSNQCSEEMLRILAQFENRLKSLHESIIPIAKSSDQLSIRQKNVEAVLKNLSTVKNHFDVCDRPESSYGESLSESNVDDYIDWLNDLHNAIEFFKAHGLATSQHQDVNSSQYLRMTRQFSTGVESVTGYLRRSVQAVSDNQRLNKETLLEVALDNRIAEKQRFSIASEKDLAKLNKLILWLRANSQTDYFAVYVEEREKKFSHLYKASRAKIHGHFKDPDTLNTIWGLSNRASFGRSSSNMAKKSKFYTTVASVVSETSGSVQSREDVDYQLGCLDCCLRALLVMTEAEWELCGHVIPDDDRRKVFEQIIDGAFYSKAESIKTDASVVQTTSSRSASLRSRPFAGAFLFSSFLTRTRPIVNSFRRIITKSGPLTLVINEFVNFTRHVLDQALHGMIEIDRREPLPSDGIVDEYTADVMSFLRDLAKVWQAVGLAKTEHVLERLKADADSVLVERLDQSEASFGELVELRKARRTAGGGPDDEFAELDAFTAYCSQVVSNIQHNVVVRGQQAASGPDNLLSIIYLLNNLTFIRSKLVELDLVPLLRCYDQDQGKWIISRLINDQERAYHERTMRIMQPLMADVALQASTTSTSVALPADQVKHNQKRRQETKDHFSTFNRELEQLLHQQARYSIVDADLKKRLHRTLRDQLLRLYKQFFNAYINETFTNPSKYIKYKPEEVDAKLHKLFFGEAI